MPPRSSNPLLADSPLRSYGRRRGRKLRPGKQSLMESRLPQVKIGIEELKNGRTEEDFHLLFPQFSSSSVPQFYLEIGFGGGEHLAHQAALHPDRRFIGCEPYINGVGDLLKKIDAQKLTNIRIFNDDARLLIETLPDACLAGVYILYPDPWPKARHHKRRLISTEFLDSLARVMAPGATLQLATDHADYATWMLERLLPHPAFAWTASACGDWLHPPPDWITTKYEQKRLAGSPTYLAFTRR